MDAVAGKVDAFLIGNSMMRETRPDLAARAIVFGQVKVCGLTTPADAARAHAAGATLGGVVFAAESPRRVDERQAAAIAAGPLPLVGVFVNEPMERIIELAGRLALAAVQLHGEETAEEVAALRAALPPAIEVWKAVRVADRIASSPRRPTGCCSMPATRAFAGEPGSGSTGGCCRVLLRGTGWCSPAASKPATCGRPSGSASARSM